MPPIHKINKSVFLLESMAGIADFNIGSAVNTTEISKGVVSGFMDSLPPELMAKISFITDLAQYFLIILIIYLIFMIIRQIMYLRDSHHLTVIARNTTQINEKLDSVVHKKKKTEKDKKE